MSEENKAYYRRFIDEVINKKNVALIDELVAPDYIEHDDVPGLPANRDGLKQLIGMMFSGFPDHQTATDDLVAEGDTVVGRHTTTGTHKGEFMGIPATGKQVTVAEIHIVRIVNGKAVEHWGQVDELGMMQQLGVVPAG